MEISMKFYNALIFAAVMTAINLTWAEEEISDDVIFITGGEQQLSQVTGSADVINRAELETFDYSDIAQTVKKVPGVYVREEDGFGLRPNVGIRGGAAERSQKITLMEDGILISPAPYSAPAAYYFPNVARMYATEIFKGPSAIQYGPQTVGGALNLVSYPVSSSETYEFDLGYGSFDTLKARGLYSNSWQNEQGEWGYLIEGLRYQSNGFKEYANSDKDSGFERNDINVKLKWSSSLNAKYPQSITMKYGYADEDSNETYLGLTESDFKADERQRYIGSEKDNFISEHYQYHILHNIELSPALSLSNKLYYNSYKRDWFKFDGFRALAGLSPVKGSDIFTDSDLYQGNIAILRGEADSISQADQLDITDFARDYGSYGVETIVNYTTDVDWFDFSMISDTKLGLRFHQDYVERNHVASYFAMTDGALIDTGDRETILNNEDNAEAFSLFINEKLSFNKWIVSAGLRFEEITTEREELSPIARNNKQTQNIILPGLGVNYQYSDSINLLGGVHKGFSPNAASLNDAEPETTINYELGGHYEEGDLLLKAISFYSDYSNLIGRCRVSDGTSCADVSEFNAGSVAIYGLEASAEYLLASESYSFPLSFVYTSTKSRFNDSFDSGFKPWGSVKEGDELPYLPEHRLRFDTGIVGEDWDMNFAVSYRAAMRERAGQGNFLSDYYIPELTTFDLSANYFMSYNWQLQFAVDNVFNEQKVVSRRPFGARPNKPRSAMLTVKYRY